MCHTCNNPTFICKCDTSWDYFDTILKNNCSGCKTEEIIYTSLCISTMTICFNFNQNIDLTLL